jgi:hypothetical protein
MKSSTQLKALIRNLAKEKKVHAQILMRNYMLERLLERISLSKYKYNFILKGGMLIAAWLDWMPERLWTWILPLRAFPLSDEAVKNAFEDIISVPIDDGTEIKIKSEESIHDEADYGGLRVSLEAFKQHK